MWARRALNRPKRRFWARAEEATRRCSAGGEQFRQPPPAYATLAIAGVAGIAGQLVTYPLDLARATLAVETRLDMRPPTKRSLREQGGRLYAAARARAASPRPRLDPAKALARLSGPPGAFKRP